VKWWIVVLLATQVMAWLPYGKALQLSQVDGKPIFIDVYADYCLPCREMEATTYKDSLVSHALTTEYHSVRMNVQSTDRIVCGALPQSVTDCLTTKWGVEGVPSIVFLDAKGEVLLSLTGFLTAPELLHIFQQVQAHIRGLP